MAIKDATKERVRGDGDVPSPWELYRTAIEDDLLSPLRKDARIGEAILEQVSYHSDFFDTTPGFYHSDIY
jgi:hypothetical protein